MTNQYTDFIHYGFIKMFLNGEFRLNFASYHCIIQEENMIMVKTFIVVAS